MLWLKLESRMIVRSLAVPISALLVLLAFGVVAGGCGETTSSDFGSLRVHIVAPDGTGLPGAKVVSDTQPAGQLKVTGITSPDGVATYAGLKPGTYEFYVSRFDYDQKSFTVVVPGDTTTNITVTLSRTAQ